jgi:hypothetical protein
MSGGNSMAVLILTIIGAVLDAMEIIQIILDFTKVALSAQV